MNARATASPSSSRTARCAAIPSCSLATLTSGGDCGCKLGLTRAEHWESAQRAGCRAVTVDCASLGTGHSPMPACFTAAEPALLLLVVPAYGLPQLDLVVVGIHDPGKSPVVVVVRPLDDGHAIFTQLREHLVEVVYAVVDHEA